MATEILVLAASVVLLFAHITVQAMARGRLRLDAATTDRLERALRNFLETYPAFIGLALALEVTGQAGGVGAIGAVVWLVARIAYLPLYAYGMQPMRSTVWTVSVIGLVLMLAGLFV